jgi:hypothetical protein
MKRSLPLDDEKSDEQVIEAMERGEITGFEVATHPLYAEFRTRQSRDVSPSTAGGKSAADPSA